MKVLAFDFGASSGRAILGNYENGKLTYKEIHRFPNGGKMTENGLRWEYDRLEEEVVIGLQKAVKEGGFDAIGIDTWGVDYGFLANGKLLASPYCYRDERTESVYDEVMSKIGDELYSRTGIQIMRINTIFQLYESMKNDPNYQKADKMIFMPDLFAYMLTGNAVAEYTIASTSGMLNPETKEWDTELLVKLGIRTDILPEIVQSGSLYGHLKSELCQKLGIDSVPVVAVCGHDTGSAVVAVPATGKDFCYISCGTWSLMGVELDKPLLNQKSKEENYTNEGGYAGTIRYLKNIMGLWIIQECKRNWKEQGVDLSFGEIMVEAEKSNSVAFIDPDDAMFEKPCNMPEVIKEYCKKTNQVVPNTIGEIARCVYESLACKYRYTLDKLHDITGKNFDEINIIGGGGQNTYLCKKTADICGVKVTAGPYEATALGNMAVQLVSLGAIRDLDEIRKVIRENEKVNTYMPEGNWDQTYQQFLKVIKE